MRFDEDTLKDIEETLSHIEKIVESEAKAIPEEKRRRVQEILDHPDRYYVEGDELLIHGSSPLLEGSPFEKKGDIPLERIRVVDLIGDEAMGFFNAVYLGKTARFLFPNATSFRSSSAYIHFAPFKEALKKRMEEEEESDKTLWFGFAYGDDIYTLEYAGESGLDLYCASHPFANVAFNPLPLSLANIEPPRIESRYIERLRISGEGISSLSSFRKGLFESGLECLLDECENLKEIEIASNCPLKDEVIRIAKEREIKVIE